MNSITNMELNRRIAAGTGALLFAACAFIIGLNTYSIWLDEYNVLSASVTLTLRSGHPPLYFVLLKGWSLLVGKSDAALRAMSAFSAMLAGAFIYRMALDVGRRVFAGLAAVTLFASMGFVRYHVHQIHNYAFLIALVVALLFFYLRWWRNSHQKLYAVGIVLITATLLYTHYYAVFAIIALNVWALIETSQSSKRWLQWIMLQMVAVVLYLPWLSEILRIVNRTLLNSSVDSPGRIPTGMATRWKPLANSITVMLSERVWVYGLLLLIGLIGLFTQNDSDQVKRRTGMFSAFIALSVGAALITNLFYVTYHPRRIIYILPVLALLIGVLLSRLHAYVRWLSLASVVVVALLATWSDTLPGNWYYRDAIEAVNSEPQDVVLLQFGNDPFAEPVLFYYAEQLLPEGVIVLSNGKTDFRQPVKRNEFEEYFADYVWARDHFWVLHAARSEFGYTSTAWATEIAGKQFTETSSHTELWFEVSQFTETQRECATQPGPVYHFGESFTLLQYQVSTLAKQGEVLPIELHWKAEVPISQEFAFSLHLLTEDRQSVTQIDTRPIHQGRTFPATLWQPGYTICGTYELPIPENLPPGSYQLVLVVYDQYSVERLPIQGQDDDLLTLTTIDIIP